jgi:hypothetical protein
VTSQSNEDEIIAAIFADIGTESKRFIEFGCGDGRQNNTIELLLAQDGWHGLWFEPHKRRYISAKERWAQFPVEVRRRIITPEKVNVVVKDPIDFLSIDIDGDDFNVWQALEARPRVVCIEVDPVNGTPLEAMKALGYLKGYKFLCTSAHNVNAFFALP